MIKRKHEVLASPGQMTGEAAPDVLGRIHGPVGKRGNPGKPSLHRGRFSNTSFATGSAEKALGQPA